MKKEMKNEERKINVLGFFIVIMIEYCYEIDNLCGFFKIVSNGGQYICFIYIFLVRNKNENEC